MAGKSLGHLQVVPWASVRVAQISFGRAGRLGTKSGPLRDFQLPSRFLETRSGSRTERAHPGRAAQRAGSLAPTASALLFRRLELGVLATSQCA